MLAIPHEFEVHQSTSLNSFDSIGFQSETSIDGSFSYVFTKPGTYYYSTDVQSIHPMSGTIIVRPLEDIVTELVVTVNGISSMYNITEDCPEENNESSGMMMYNCSTDVNDDRLHTEPPLFVYSQCNTPFVHSIDNGHAILTSEIHITGDNLGSNIKIAFSDIECYPNAITDDLIRCVLDQYSTPMPFVYHPLSLHVDNYGYALLLGENEGNRSISVNPVITDIQPDIGSVLGGNTIVIQGLSFFQEYLQVVIGESAQCIVETVNYTTISCVVPQEQDQSESIELVTIRNSQLLSQPSYGSMDNSYYNDTVLNLYSSFYISDHQKLW